MEKLAEHAGRCLMVGIPGPSLDGPARGALESLRPGGVILFRRNLDDPGQLARLIGDLQEVLAPPTLVALDQEGGRVSRLERFIGPTPSAVDLARAGDSPTSAFGQATASALRALGFNLDFAPVVDLCEARAENGIGNRSFGTDPIRVSSLAGSFLDGLQRAGVAGCLKHFPGLGDTDVDSHDRLPTVRRGMQRLDSEDLLPYRSLADRAASVMVGHGHYPALDPRPGLPATLSPAIVSGLLRDRIGFGGLVVSDDLEMGAVAAIDRGGSAAVAAVAAGCDLILYCSDLERARIAHAALLDAAKADRGFAERLEAAASAVTRTASAWPAPRPDPTAWDEARRGMLDTSRLA